MRLEQILLEFRPESWGGTRGETWLEHARYLWSLDPAYMQGLVEYMQDLEAWFERPVSVDAGVVQDGHHRIVVGASLGQLDLEVPVLYF